MLIKMFIEIPTQFLSSIATDSERVPTLYYSKYLLVRKFFWMRLRLIYLQIIQDKQPKITCLDFGGGGGVFLPTLSKIFKTVICVDMEDYEAKRVVNEYKLSNVRLIRSDISDLSSEFGRFDTIIAADVLEHFKDLSVPVKYLKRWLAEDGVLYTSLPSENFIYILLRRVFNITKPLDHYYSGYDVENYLRDNGFKQIYRAYVPFYFRLSPLFLISGWRINSF